MLRFFFFISVTASIWTACNEPSGSGTGNVSTSGSIKKMSEKPEMPDWAKNAVLYELNIRQFSPEGNFAGVTAQLPRLKDLGIDIVWLMPVHPIGKERRKGSLGSPYSVYDFKAVNPDFGTESDLKNLVQTAHQLGLKVILDWVPNHTSWDAVWKQNHPDFYTKINGEFTVPMNEHGQPVADWTDICDLDYNHPGTRKAMIDAMQYWIKSFDIDGFRCDMAGLVPNDFWNEVRPALDTLKPVLMLAEWQDEPGHFNSCFQVNYGWKWKDVTKDIAAGKQNAHSLDTLLTFLNDFYPRDYCQLYFTQNHDENSWNGTEAELYGPAADVFNVLAFTWQGIPMIYNGQEDGLNQRLKFFDKDLIHWKKYDRKILFQKLADLRHLNQSLWSGAAGGQLTRFVTSDDTDIYAFGREKNGDRSIVIANLCKHNRTVTVRPNSDFSGAYANVFGENTMQVTTEMQMNLKPWEYIVLTNK
jgi:alpha-amylase